MIKLWSSKHLKSTGRRVTIYPAKWWYGKHATGAVVVSGVALFHGTTKEAKQFFKDLK